MNEWVEERANACFPGIPDRQAAPGRRARPERRRQGERLRFDTAQAKVTRLEEAQKQY